MELKRVIEQAQRYRYESFQDCFGNGWEADCIALDQWGGAVRRFLSEHREELQKVRPGHYKFLLKWSEE